MTTRRPLILAILSVFFLTSTAQAAESVSVLLQKGIYAEETEGNLDAAIRIYEGITKESDANRSLVAQAQYRLGVCELKRGKKEEAEAAFRKIIGQFSDQSELSSKARERLGELGKSVSSVIVRQVWSGIGAFGHSVSLDGRYFAIVDFRTGDVALRDLHLQQNRLLTDNTSGENYENWVLSHDAKQVAYSAVHYGNSFSSGLRIVSVEKSVSRVVINQQTNRWLWAEDWSPNGKWIAAIDIQWQQGYMPEMQATNSKTRISLISTADGAIGKLISLGGISWSSVSNLRFSPDGRYLAYNLARNGNAGGRIQPTNDIVVMEMETDVQKVAVEYAAHENFVGWAPGSSDILFTSDRSGTTGLWSQSRTQEGATPKLLKADIGDIEPIRLTRDGALFYNLTTGPLKEYYLVSVDFETGQIIKSPKLVRTALMRSAVSSWGDKMIGTANGRFLYYRSEEKEPAAYVFDLESKEQREIPNSRRWANRIGWWWRSVDFKFLFVSLPGPENEGGLYKVSTETGEIAPVAIRRAGVDQMFNSNPIQFRVYRDFVAFGRHYINDDKFVLVKHDLASGKQTEYSIPGLAELPGGNIRGNNRNGAVLSSDGRTVFFNRRKASEGQYVLVWHDLVTGIQKQLLNSKFPIGTLVDENDRKLLNLFVTADERKIPGKPDGVKPLVFTLFSLEGSDLRQTHQVTLPDGFEYRGQHWGEPHLLLIKSFKQAPGPPAEMWTLSVRTGELKNLGLSVANDQSWGLAEDGKRFVFQTTTPGSREVWVTENFLPPVTAVK